MPFFFFMFTCCFKTVSQCPSVFLVKRLAAGSSGHATGYPGAAYPSAYPGQNVGTPMGSHSGGGGGLLGSLGGALGMATMGAAILNPVSKN